MKTTKHKTYWDFNDMTVRQINKYFRERDNSFVYPICGRFNVTERAIRRVRKYMQKNGAISGLEYAEVLGGEISRIVNP